jgi:hypothetical protein
MGCGDAVCSSLTREILHDRINRLTGKSRMRSSNVVQYRLRNFPAAQPGAVRRRLCGGDLRDTCKPSDAP